MDTYTAKAGTSEVLLQLIDSNPACEYVVEERASLTIVVYASGDSSVDGTVHVRLTGSHSEAFIYGLFLNETQTIKLHTLQQHEAFDTTSSLLVKSVLRGKGTFYYDGAIRVEKAGQKTDAYQRNENLLLSNQAFAESKPSLEILADDVRCTHGATIGSIDEEELFYLSTRGIAPDKGKHLITEGFFESVLEKIPDHNKVEEVRRVIWKNL